MAEPLPTPAFLASAPKSPLQAHGDGPYAPMPSSTSAPLGSRPCLVPHTGPAPGVLEHTPASPHASTTPPSSMSHLSDGSPPAPSPRGRNPRLQVTIPDRNASASTSRVRDMSAPNSAIGSRSSTPSLPLSPSLMFHQGDQLLQPGAQASRLSHEKTLEMYRQNAKKHQDPDLMYELAVIMIESSTKSGSGAERTELVKDAITLLRKISDRGHADAQYFLGDIYARGLVTEKPQYDKAYPKFILASKHGHAHAAFRAAQLLEKGLGCMQSNNKALKLYHKAAAQGHPGAMFRLGSADLNGELGLEKNAKGGVKWIKLAADHATPEFPQALHELALLHQRGIDNVVFQDDDYSCELLARAAELGFAPSAYKLGMNYEYGKMGCSSDPGLSIHMYNVAAQQDHPHACFALCAWFLVGAPGILPQSDTEAFLWAKKAADQGLAKAEYAVGYFSEMGVGTSKDLPRAKAWYSLALEHGDRRASSRIQQLGGVSAMKLPKPLMKSPQAPTSLTSTK